jgi:hypothetical protein
MPTMTIGHTQHPPEPLEMITNMNNTMARPNELQHPGKAIAEARALGVSLATISPDKDHLISPDKDHRRDEMTDGTTHDNDTTHPDMEIDPIMDNAVDDNAMDKPDAMVIDKKNPQNDSHTQATTRNHDINTRLAQGRGAALQRHYPGRGSSLHRHLAHTAHTHQPTIHQDKIDAMRAAGMPTAAVQVIAAEMHRYTSSLHNPGSTQATTPHSTHENSTLTTTKKKKPLKQNASILYHTTKEPQQAHDPTDNNKPMTVTDYLDASANNHDAPHESDEGDFIIVERKKKTSIKTPAEEKAHNFGVIITKVARRAVIANSTINIMQLFEEILKVDPEVILLSHDNDKTTPLTMAKLKKMNVQEYNRLLDFVILDWGKPADEQGKLAFSFYLASNVIQPDLALLKDSNAVMTTLAKMGLTINRHHLLETEEKRVGFFLGKSPDKTWRGGLEARFHEYLSTVLTPDNLNTFRDNNPKFPEWIPFSIRTAQLHDKARSTPAIMLYVGQSDVKPIEYILQHFPFSLEIVSMITKRKDRVKFAKQVDLHTIICQNSQAIKITEVDRQFKQRLRDVARQNANVSDMVLDVADSSSEDIIFLQCMPRVKSALTEWLVQFIGDYINRYPDATPTIAALVRPPPEDVNHTWSKHQHLLDDDTYRSTLLPSPPTQRSTPNNRSNWKHLPSIILTCEHISYASAVSNREPASQMSSPTNSVVTEKTIQSTPWAEDMAAMKQDILMLRNAANSRKDASSVHSDTSKKSAREIALEEVILKLNTTLQEKSQREEDLLIQLTKQAAAQAEREEDLITHIKQQAANHKAEIVDMKANYNNMMEVMLQMSRKLDGMSPPRKRSARSPQSENDADAESNSASMDTTLTPHSQSSIPFNPSTSVDDNLSVIQDISVIQQEPTDPDCATQSHNLRSLDFPHEPPVC